MRLLLLLPLILLAACNKEPSFDEKYKEQSDHISTTANGIEKELADQMTGAAEADRAAAELQARNPVPGNSASIP